MEKNIVNFIICISTSIISLSIGIYYTRKYKKENYKPQYGVKRDSNIDYYKDGFKILSYFRSYALIYIGALFFIFAITALFRK